MHNFRKLEFWKKSRVLVNEIYHLTKEFPNEEKFGLSNQMRRAAISIISNIAEGAGRRSIKEFKHFLDISSGSLSELDAQILISLDLEFIEESQQLKLANKISEIQKMIYSFKTKIRA